MEKTLGTALTIVGVAMLAGCSSNKHQGTTVAYDSGYVAHESTYVATSYDHEATPAYERSSTIVSDSLAEPYAPVAPRETYHPAPVTAVQSNTRTTFLPVAMRTPRSDITFNELRGHVQSQSAVIVDAREPKHFKKGHVRGAINIPAGDEDAYIAKFRKEVAPESMVIVYCGGPDCPAGENVATYLSTQGYTNLRVYTPGWQQLSKTDLNQ